MYSKVCTALNAIHNSRSASSKVKDLTRIIEERQVTHGLMKRIGVELYVFVLYSCSSSGKLNVITPSGRNAAMSKSSCLKMALWLAVYNEFFTKNVSRVLCLHNLFHT